MKRDEFLARVKSAAVAGRAYRPAVRTDVPDSAGYVGGGDDLCAKLAAEVNAVGGRAVVVAGLVEARATLVELLTQYSPRAALCWEHPVLQQMRLAELLAERGVEYMCNASLATLSPAEQRAKMLAADVGITSATFAIAETGSLAMAAGPQRERAASLLPPVHIAIVTAEQILPDLFDLFARQVEAGATTISPNLTLITGPSKTGDIELQLTTGVHGPGKWHVVMVRERS